MKDINCVFIGKSDCINFGQTGVYDPDDKLFYPDGGNLGIPQWEAKDVKKEELFFGYPEYCNL